MSGTQNILLGFLHPVHFVGRDARLCVCMCVCVFVCVRALTQADRSVCVLPLYTTEMVKEKIAGTYCYLLSRASRLMAVRKPGHCLVDRSVEHLWSAMIG